MSSRISQFKHIFFDFDGTLCESEKDLKKAWLKVLADMKRSVPEFDKIFRVGPPIQEIAKNLLPDLSDSEREEVLKEFKNYYDYTSPYDETFIYPWMDKFLRHLRENGSSIYILTNKRRYPTMRLLKKFGWEELFSGVFTPDYQEGKILKKSDLMGILLKELNIDPAQAVMVGDTPADITVGKNNRTATAGVLWGYGTCEELTASNCDILLSQKDFEQWL